MTDDENRFAVGGSLNNQALVAHLGAQHDIADADLDYLMNNVADAIGVLRPLILEIRRHRTAQAALTQQTAALVELCRAIDACPQVMANGRSLSNIDPDWWTWLRQVQTFNDQVRAAIPVTNALMEP